MDAATLERLAAALPDEGLTLGECIDRAEREGVRASDVMIAEAMRRTGLDGEGVLEATLAAFAHNLHAVEIGKTGHSFIMGDVGRDLADGASLFGDELVDRTLARTLAAQVGNHEIGLRPCAGTGDACPYAGLIQALAELGADRETLGRTAVIVTKIGSLFRAGKSTTGCNMEGFAAGGSALAAAFTELEGGTPSMIGHAVALALSPTIGVPCTPRVMVPGLCAAHIGGAVIMGRLASRLALRTSLPVTVPVDVMLALAAAVHPLAASHLVPTVIEYMEPFFRTHPGVERHIDPAIKEAEAHRADAVRERAREEARALARKARPVTDPFGQPVVGGSSQAVGSPTNAARIAHALLPPGATPRRIDVELYPELFARRGINVPGILMAAAYGAGTGDGGLYREVMDRIAADGIEVSIRMILDRPQWQRITVAADTGRSEVASLNRGGARLHLVDAFPGTDAAREAAARLGIELVD